MSSEAALATYSFRQLEGPRQTSAPGDALAAAVAEADGIREAARLAGEAEGHAAGLQAAHAESASLLQALAAACQELEDVRAQVVAALEVDAVTLGLRLAEQIVAGALAVAPERIVDVTGLALRRLIDRRSVILVVNPADLELLSAAADALQSELGGIDHLSIQADRRVGRGGVIARTDEGEIDATVETQLARARELVAAELSAGGAPTGDPVGGEMAVSTGAVPTESVPAEVVTAEVVTAESVPAGVVPAEVVPAEVVPAEVLASEIVEAAPVDGTTR